MPSAKNTTSKLNIDPGVPRDDPTISYWQQPLHPLAAVASESLASCTDVLVIGSGITGCSVAKTILEQHETLNVTVLEARGLASGASSRNGGHIVSPSFGDFIQLVETFGPKAAVEIAVFSHDNVDATFEAVAELKDLDLTKVSELRRTEKVLGIADQVTLTGLQMTLDLWNKHMPASRQNPCRIIGAEEALEQYGLKNVAGASVGRAAAAWPYRLWTGIWANLHKRFPSRLSIETFTPALNVSNVTEDNEYYKYTVETPRGSIRTAHVVYATNAFTSHFLPSLQDKMFPIRGTMSTQDLGDSFPKHGSARSWSFLSQPQFDPNTGTANSGLYYLTQHPTSGFMFLGGEHETAQTMLSADDRVINPTSAKKIIQVLPEAFTEVPSGKPDLVAIWSGIMGFSRDGIPLTGRVPNFATPRTENQEWIAAGFNGNGTGYCFLCGKAVGEMILGKEVPWLPNAFEVTEKRFYGSLTSSTFWDGIIGPIESHED